jgi:hypothetical protein
MSNNNSQPGITKALAVLNKLATSILWHLVFPKYTINPKKDGILSS